MRGEIAVGANISAPKLILFLISKGGLSRENGTVDMSDP